MPRNSGIHLAAISLCLILAACDRQADTPEEARPSSSAAPMSTPTAEVALQADAEWQLQSSDEGVALTFTSSADTTVIRLFCPVSANRLVVNVPGFKPIASEERLSFGSGGEATALVANSRGDKLRGGVSGEGEVPANLAALIGGAVSASYGAQQSGPHPVPQPAVARAFVNACQETEPVVVER